LRSQYQVETSLAGVFREIVSSSLQVHDPAGSPPIQVEQVRDTNDEYIWQSGENLSEKIKKNIFVRIQVSKRQCLVGEPILVTYKLYSRLNSESLISKSPLLAGFSVYEMGRVDIDTTSTETVNGKPFRVRVLLKKQLIPLVTGSMELDPMEIQNTIHFIKSTGLPRQKGNSLNELLDQFSKEEKAQPVTRSYFIRTKPLSIIVNSTPEANRPPHYSGLVGNFNIDAELSRKQLIANDTVVFTLRIRGSGYLPLLNSPDIHWPAETEVYAPRVIESLDKSSFPLKGSKTFVYTFSSKAIGIHTILPVSLSYFNPVANQYQTIQSSASSFEVSVAELKKNLPIPPAESSDSIRIRKGFTNHPVIIFMRDHSGWLLITCSLFFMIIYLVFQNWQLRNSDSAPIPVEPIPPATALLEPPPPPEPLVLARELVENKKYEDFYREITRILYQEIGTKLDIPGSELNKNKIQDLLIVRGWTQEMFDQLIGVLYDCEVRLYTPGQQELDVLTVLERADKVLLQIEKS
jgi:hypothetical protein